MSLQKSTNDRPKNAVPKAPNPVRLAFGVLERVAPAAGAAWAVRLWFRLPSVPAVVRQRRSQVDLPPRSRFTVELGDARIRGTSWGAGPAVYLVHGWGGWGEQLASYVGPLVAAGYRVVAYDAPSHGESSPGVYGAGRTTVLEIAAALRAVVDAQGPAYALVAHSIGAMATARALRDGLDVERLVFVAPAASVAPMTGFFGAMLGFGPRVARRLMPRVERYVGESMAGLDVPTQGRRLRAQGRLPELLVVHDTDDLEVPWSGAGDIVEAWQARPLVSTSGLGHRRVLRSEPVVTEAVEFLTDETVRRDEPAQDRMAG